MPPLNWDSSSSTSSSADTGRTDHAHPKQRTFGNGRDYSIGPRSTPQGSPRPRELSLLLQGSASPSGVLREAVLTSLRAASRSTSRHPPSRHLVSGHAAT